jgi:hypothetical protein
MDTMESIWTKMNVFEQDLDSIPLDGGMDNMNSIWTNIWTACLGQHIG